MRYSKLALLVHALVVAFPAFGQPTPPGLPSTLSPRLPDLPSRSANSVKARPQTAVVAPRPNLDLDLEISYVVPAPRVAPPAPAIVPAPAPAPVPVPVAEVKRLTVPAAAPVAVLASKEVVAPEQKDPAPPPPAEKPVIDPATRDSATVEAKTSPAANVSEKPAQETAPAPAAPLHVASKATVEHELPVVVPSPTAPPAAKVEPPKEVAASLAPRAEVEPQVPAVGQRAPVPEPVQLAIGTTLLDALAAPRAVPVELFKQPVAEAPVAAADEIVKLLAEPQQLDAPVVVTVTAEVPPAPPPSNGPLNTRAMRSLKAKQAPMTAARSDTPELPTAMADLKSVPDAKHPVAEALLPWPEGLVQCFGDAARGSWTTIALPYALLVQDKPTTVAEPVDEAPLELHVKPSAKVVDEVPLELNVKASNAPLAPGVSKQPDEEAPLELKVVPSKKVGLAPAPAAVERTAAAAPEKTNEPERPGKASAGLPPLPPGMVGQRLPAANAPTSTLASRKAPRVTVVAASRNTRAGAIPDERDIKATVPSIGAPGVRANDYYMPALCVDHEEAANEYVVGPGRIVQHTGPAAPLTKFTVEKGDSLRNLLTYWAGTEYTVSWEANANKDVVLMAPANFGANRAVAVEALMQTIGTAMPLQFQAYPKNKVWVIRGEIPAERCGSPVRE